MTKGNVKRFTAESVRKMKAPETGRFEQYDAKVSGLFLRITSTGRKSWGLDYRFHGKRRRIMFGSCPSVGLEEARNSAEGVKLQVRQGTDPATEKRKAKEDTPAPTSFGETVELFLRRHASKNKSYNEIERIFRVYVLPKWQRHALDEIKRKDVIVLLDRVEDENGAVMADHVLAQIRKFFNWCVERDLREYSPIVRGMRRSNPRQRQRERWLRDEEIAQVWQGAEQLGYPFGAFIKMLLITGQRREEVASMRWDEITGNVWTIPAAKTKNGRAHDVPLSELAQQVLSDLPRVGDYLFVSGRSRSGRPISGFSKAKQRLDGLTGELSEPWVLHDLRRTVRTHMSALGVQRDVAERVLNHTDGTINAVYDRHDYAAEKEEALGCWGRKLRVFT